MDQTQDHVNKDKNAAIFSFNNQTSYLVPHRIEVEIGREWDCQKLCSRKYPKQCPLKVT